MSRTEASAIRYCRPNPLADARAGHVDGHPEVLGTLGRAAGDVAAQVLEVSKLVGADGRGRALNEARGLLLVQLRSEDGVISSARHRPPSAPRSPRTTSAES